jgi:hypothetical protein
VGRRAGLDTEARGKILCPCRGSNPDRPNTAETNEQANCVRETTLSSKYSVLSIIQANCGGENARMIERHG